MNKEEQQKQEERKDLLDPVTSAAIGAGMWFAIKSALSAIVGFLALEWFKKVREWWKGDDVEADDQRVPEEEQNTA